MSIIFGFKTKSCATVVPYLSEFQFEMGTIDKGGSKVWTDFGPSYYAAYLTDPDDW